MLIETELHIAKFLSQSNSGLRFRLLELIDYNTDLKIIKKVNITQADDIVSSLNEVEKERLGVAYNFMRKFMAAFRRRPTQEEWAAWFDDKNRNNH